MYWHTITIENRSCYNSLGRAGNETIICTIFLQQLQALTQAALLAVREGTHKRVRELQMEGRKS